MHVHIENHKQNTADLQLVALFPSHLVLVQFSAHKHRLDGGVDFKAQILKLFVIYLDTDWVPRSLN